jgi:prostatic aicd phosphatase
MSLELVLASLFPPIPTEFGSPDLNWQPIPFNIEQAGGILGVASSYCANYINAYFQYVLSKDAQKIRDGYKNLYEELSRYAGFKVTTPRDAGSIYFTLKSEVSLTYLIIS